MGKNQYIFYVILVMSMLILANGVLAVAGNDINECCVSIDIDASNGLLGLVFSDYEIQNKNCSSIGYSSYGYLPDCGENTANNPLLELGCCCENGNPMIESDNTNEYGRVTKGWCEFKDGVFYSVSEDNQENHCNEIECTTGESDTSDNPDYYTVYGYVHLNFSDDIADGLPKVIAGVNIQASPDDSSPYASNTNNEGYYLLDGLPGAEEGYVDFFLTFNDIAMNYECEDLAVNNVEIYSDSEINFTLQCKVSSNVCVPNWNLTYNATDCIPYGEQWVRLLEYEDLENCGTNFGKPSTYEICNDIDTEEGSCNDGKLDFGEECDSYQVTTIYRDLDNTENILDGSFSCEDYLSDYTGYMKCSNCAYDISECIPKCDGVCDRLSDCTDCPDDCEIPLNPNSLCGNTCSGIKPDFLYMTNTEFPTDLLNQDTVNDLYNYIKENNDQALPQYHAIFPGVKYTEGTRDVTLSWGYNGSCISQISGFKIQMCLEDLEEQNKCGSEITDKYIYATQSSMYYATFTDVLKSLEELGENNKYCYNVCAMNFNGEEYCAFNDTQLPCFKTGNTNCMEEHENGRNCIEQHNGDNLQINAVGCGTDDAGVYTTLISEDNTEECNGNTVCVETYYDGTANSGAKCVAQGQCEICNGMFGLFARYKLDSYLGTDSTDTVKCENFEYNPKNPEFPNHDNAVGLCYLEKTKSVSDKYKNCSIVKSCYDYNSFETCTNDPCFKFTHILDNDISINNCIWEDVYGELGIGICRPKDEEKEDCSICDSNSPIGFCNEDLCSAYGNNTCYYKESITRHNPNDINEDDILFRNYDNYPVPTCIHKRDMACVLYQSKEDCVGSENGGSENVDVDVIYELNNGIYGTNEIIKNSSDVFKFGRCAWNDNESSKNYGCHKNSDDLYKIKFNDGEILDTDDCYGQMGDKKTCYSDITPPNTTIKLRNSEDDAFYDIHGVSEKLPVYGIPELFNLSYVVTDDVYTESKLFTKFSYVPVEKCSNVNGGINCFNIENKGAPDMSKLDEIKICQDAGCYVYPNYKKKYGKSFTDIPTIDDFLQLSSFNGSNVSSLVKYKLRYFSYDNSMNIEVVKEKDLWVDGRPPKLTNDINYTITSFHVGEDIYISELNISFGIDEPSICHGRLSRKDADGLSYNMGNFDMYGNIFNTTYPTLVDGLYEFELICDDMFKNHMYKTELIPIEGDMSIYGANPRTKTYRNFEDIETLNINTLNNATCHLDLGKQGYEDSVYLFDSKDGLNHTKEFQDIVTTSSTAEGRDNIVFENRTYIFYTSCKYDNGDITELNPFDMISFTIDQMPPQVTLLNTDKGVTGAFTDGEASWSEDRQFVIYANDDNSVMPIGSFGIEEIAYCISNITVDVEDFIPETYCTSEWIIQQFDDNRQNASITLPIIDESNVYEYAGKVIYYTAKDNGGNLAKIQRMNMKVRDLEFEEAKISVS